MRAVPRLCEFYPGICLTTEEKAWKNLSQGKKNLSQVKKNLTQVKKNLSQGKKNLSQGKKNLSQGKMWIFSEPSKKGHIGKYMTFCGGVKKDGVRKSKKIIKYICWLNIILKCEFFL